MERDNRVQELLESMRGKPLNGMCRACFLANPAVVEGDPPVARWEPGGQQCPSCGAEGTLHSVADPTWESPTSKIIRECFTIQPMTAPADGVFFYEHGEPEAWEDCIRCHAVKSVDPMTNQCLKCLRRDPNMKG